MTKITTEITWIDLQKLMVSTLIVSLVNWKENKSHMAQKITRAIYRVKEIFRNKR
jgi:hypothetical protein